MKERDEGPGQDEADDHESKSKSVPSVIVWWVTEVLSTSNGKQLADHQNHRQYSRPLQEVRMIVLREFMGWRQLVPFCVPEHVAVQPRLKKNNLGICATSDEESGDKPDPSGWPGKKDDVSYRGKCKARH